MNFIDHELTGEHAPQIFNREHAIGTFHLYRCGRRWLAGCFSGCFPGWSDESEYPHPMPVIVLQAACQRPRFIAQTNDEDVALGPKPAADNGNKIARANTEQDQEQPACSDEKTQEYPADIQFCGVHQYDERERARCHLAERMAQNHARTNGFQLPINIEPIAETHPGQKAEAQQQSPHIGRQKKSKPERSVLSNLVGKCESSGGQNSVRKPEQDFQLASLAAKHFTW